MPKVRMKTGMSGARGYWPKGKEVDDVSPGEAERMIAAGQAEHVKATKKAAKKANPRETADRKPDETR